MSQNEPETYILIDVPENGPIITRTIHPGEDIPPAPWHETRQQRRRREREAAKRRK